MKNDTITCPSCKTEIALTEALSDRVKAETRAQLQQMTAKLNEQEKSLQEREASLQRAEEDAKTKIQTQLKVAKEEQRKELRKELEQELALESNDLKAHLEEQSASIQSLKENELSLRKELRAAKQKADDVDLELERRVDEAKKAAISEALEKSSLEYQQKEAEKEKIISDLKIQLMDMKRKVEQGSQQTQGEANEEVIFAELEKNFPDDELVEVPTGSRGGDVLQTVNTRSGRECGKILWELKKAKTWSYGWIKKLKEDVRDSGSTIGIIISDVFPKGEQRFCQIEGVWVVSPLFYIGIAIAIRNGMLELSFKELAMSGQKEKADLLYEYLTGIAFRQRIEVILESFTEMRDSLEKEKRAMQRIWKSREKQIENVLSNTAQMCGEIQGVVGTSALPVPALELPQTDRP